MKNQSKNNNYRYSLKWLTIICLIVASSQLLAAFELKKYTINNGGSKKTSQRYLLKSSIAQVDANKTLSSNSFQLTSGFWQENTDLIFFNQF